MLGRVPLNHLCALCCVSHTRHQWVAISMALTLNMPTKVPKKAPMRGAT